MGLPFEIGETKLPVSEFMHAPSSMPVFGLGLYQLPCGRATRPGMMRGVTFAWRAGGVAKAPALAKRVSFVGEWFRI